ncbi:MAG TPA: hypothetical protein VJ877_05710, partial [Bacteroidales bacterium]|nr:hypothetical protein [Bacteroidales bacterium]
NLGSDLIRENFEDFSEERAEEIIEKTRNQVFEILKKSMRPEFLNRIDELIMFKPLTRNDIRGIIDIQIRQLNKIVAKQGIDLQLTDSCKDYLQEKGFNIQFGARPLKRLIQKEITDKISVAILKGELPEGKSEILIDSDGQETEIKVKS